MIDKHHRFDRIGPSDKEVAPAEGESSRRPGPKGVSPMAKISVEEKLRVLEERYAHELLPEEERLELRETILELWKKLAAAAAAAVRA